MKATPKYLRNTEPEPYLNVSLTSTMAPETQAAVIMRAPDNYSAGWKP